ncbi:MAG: hypothetical protein HY482_01340 [Candidatus Wildermuthbacteria bacterium]|nr:hypothetical protein [Candidatus Wildermuthbacteria bacterium]
MNARTVFSWGRASYSGGDGDDIHTATIQLIRDGKEYTEAAVGNGPVDALCRAIDRVVGEHCTVGNFTVRAMDKGVNSIGLVVLHVERDGKIYPGRGESHDIIIASGKAYLNALMLALSADGEQEIIIPVVLGVAHTPMS